MTKKRICAIRAILTLLVVTLFAVSCFRPSAPPAEITARVIISEKLESGTPMPTPPSDYMYWIVKLSVKNLAYKDPIEVSREAFYNGGGWVTAQRNTNYSIYIYAFSESGRVPVGQSGEFTALFAAPTALPVGDCQIAYLAQQPTSYTTLSLEDKVAAYDWDTKTVIAKMPSHDNLVVAILVCFLLAAVRWYPDVRRIIRRDRVVKSETRIMETSLDRTLNHPILGILVIAIVGLLIYYLYPSIGYKAVIPAFAIAVVYIAGRRIRSSTLEARMRKAIRLEEEQRRRAEEEQRRAIEEAERRRAEEERIKAIEEQRRIKEQRRAIEEAERRRAEEERIKAIEEQRRIGEEKRKSIEASSRSKGVTKNRQYPQTLEDTILTIEALKSLEKAKTEKQSQEIEKPRDKTVADRERKRERTDHREIDEEEPEGRFHHSWDKKMEEFK